MSALSETLKPKAKDTFESSIKDATDLLDLFDEINAAAPPANQVLKRAALIVALTAWETYVEDRVVEVVKFRLTEQRDFSEQFLERSLQIELKRFNTPDTAKTVNCFPTSPALTSASPGVGTTTTRTE